MSTNYTNYHELKEQDKDSVQLQKTTQDPKTASSRPAGVLAKARSGLVGCIEPGSGAQGWQSLFATETEGLSPTGNSVASAEQTSAAHETNPTRLYTVSSRASLLDPGSSAQGVAKSVCHRDRRSLPKRQLRCLCRTDFGSPRNKPQQTTYRVIMGKLA